MNRLLPNGNILMGYGFEADGLYSTATMEIPPSDPQYEGCTFFMSGEDEKKALAILAEYRKNHPET